MKVFKERLSKTVLALVMGGFAVQGTAGQEVHRFSATQAVAYAMKNSGQVKNNLTDIKIQQQQNREITAAAYPQITGNVNLTDYVNIPTTLIPGEFFGQPAGTYLPVTFGTRYNTTYGLNLEQLLFDGQVFVGLQARTASIEYAQHNVEITQEQIKANVYKIYYQMVAGKIQIQTIDVNIARNEKQLHDTREMFKNGFSEQLDVDKISVTLANLHSQKNAVVNRIKSGYVGLKYLMGMPVKEELVLTDTVTEQMLKANILDTDTVRYQDRKEYQLYQTLEKLNEFNIKRYKMSYIPTLSLTGAYSRNAQRNTFDVFKSHEPWFTTTYIGFKINVPVFDGFGRDSRVKQARLNLEKTRVILEDLRNRIETQVDTSRLGLESALLTLDEQTGNMQLAEKVYDQTKKKYEQGLGSTLEITSADSELKTAQNNYFSALYDAIIARIDYLKAIGKL